MNNYEITLRVETTANMKELLEIVERHGLSVLAKPSVDILTLITRIEELKEVKI